MNTRIALKLGYAHGILDAELADQPGEGTIERNDHQAAIGWDIEPFSFRNTLDLEDIELMSENEIATLVRNTVKLWKEHLNAI